MKGFIAILLLTISLQVTGQTVWENHNAPVYGYLSRMAMKGHIELNDIILPINRGKILEHLDTLQTKQLSAIEKKELGFYLQEYKAALNPFPGAPPLTKGKNNPSSLSPHASSLSILKKDPFGRFRFLGVSNKDFKLFIDPIIGMQQTVGTPSQYRTLSNGINLWGQAGRLGFQLYYRDFGLTGSGLKLLNQENPNTAFIELFNVDPNKLNHNEVKAHMSYSWKNGSISIGKDHLLWGYGESGKIVLSDRAPSFPYLRLDYQPLKWMSFNYTHAWLNSNILDTIRTYRTGTSGVIGDIRIRYIPKFMATHSVSFLPIKGLTLSIGESMLYSDKLDIGFLIPVMFFKPYDNNRSNYVINAGSNAQFFFQASARNLIKNTHFYSTVFIDEIRLSSIFNSQKARNQLGITAGMSMTDCLLPYLTIGAEYTRVNPFVYNNLIPAQNYSQYNYSLGDWMGNNFDRAVFLMKYTPIPKLRLEMRLQKIRKAGPGTLLQQYEAEPQPPFLFDFQKNRTDMSFNVQYEWLNNLYLFGRLLSTKQSPVNAISTKYRQLNIGMSYGL